MTEAGAFEITPDVARRLLPLLYRGMRSRLRDGLGLPRGLDEAIANLSRLADTPIPRLPGSGPGTAQGIVRSEGEHLVTTAKAATEIGVSAEYVRRLARDGRVRAQRAGHAWLVDLDSLRSVHRSTRR